MAAWHCISRGAVGPSASVYWKRPCLFPMDAVLVEDAGSGGPWLTYNIGESNALSNALSDIVVIAQSERSWSSSRFGDTGPLTRACHAPSLPRCSAVTGSAISTDKQDTEYVHDKVGRSQKNGRIFGSWSIMQPARGSAGLYLHQVLSRSNLKHLQFKSDLVEPFEEYTVTFQARPAPYSLTWHLTHTTSSLGPSTLSTLLVSRAKANTLAAGKISFSYHSPAKIQKIHFDGPQSASPGP